mgnify:CR=1 FL=1
MQLCVDYPNEKRSRMINPPEIVNFIYSANPYYRRRKVEKVAKSKKNDNKFAPKDTWEPSEEYKKMK